MKVLLINPPYTREERYGKEMGKFGPLNEPLGLAYLAATLERGGHEVAILDAPALGLTLEGICRTAARGRYELVGVTMLTPMYSRSMEVVKAVRGSSPSAKIVVGGPHPTILPGETLLDSREIDYVVVGEGELILLNLVNALQGGESVEKVAGLAYRKNGALAINPPSRLVEDLDELPIPARHLLPMHAYRMTRSRTRTEHAFTVSVARGCPFHCGFCCRIFGRTVRHHSVGRILEEIEILVREHGAMEINLEADTLTLNKPFVLSLCKGLTDSGLAGKITWTCESRIDTVTEDMLRNMKDAGCWQISYGVETGSQRLLDLIQKGITLPQIEEVFAFTKRIGISIRAFYMLGLPTETREESLRTMSFARKLDARWSQFTLFTPFPGTRLYDLVVREGGLRSKDWADYKTHGGWAGGGLAYVPAGRALEEMKALQKQAYRAIYLRPRVFARFIRGVDSFAKLKEYATGLWVLIKSFFSEGSGGKEMVQRVPRQELKAHADGVYVDSPVYFDWNPLARAVNWGKLDSVMSLLPGGERGVVLDLCCGNGVMLPTLARMFECVVGVDLHVTAAARLKRGRDLRRVSLVRGDAVRLPFRGASFSLVLALSSLEHFRDLHTLAGEIERIMRPGGFLVFLSPTETGFYRLGRALLGYRKPVDHYHSSEEVLRILEKSFALEMEGRYPSCFSGAFSAYGMARFRKG